MLAKMAMLNKRGKKGVECTSCLLTSKQRLIREIKNIYGHLDGKTRKSKRFYAECFLMPTGPHMVYTYMGDITKTFVSAHIEKFVGFYYNL